ncbi:MAG: hypothetical protein NZ552_06095, partial [Planctomycetes bacterium]|nr:hypothetical protein [Planctomycetota bacterium]
ERLAAAHHGIALAEDSARQLRAAAERLRQAAAAARAAGAGAEALWELLDEAADSEEAALEQELLAQRERAELWRLAPPPLAEREGAER